MTVRDYLRSLGDDDAIVVAESAGNWADCTLDSNCGADMKKAIDGCKAAVTALDDAGAYGHDTGFRWALWHKIGLACDIFYNG